MASTSSESGPPGDRGDEGGALVQGATVRHDKHGQGVVAKVLDGGRKAIVRFDSRPAVPMVVADAALQRIGALPAPAPRPVARPVVSADAAPDRQTLEALRLGVVPARGLDRLTVGRHEELARVDELVDRASGMLVLSGGYGTGKTHMIELAASAGRQRGMLVARATFDPVEVPPSHPLRLYGALCRDLSGEDSAATGLRPLLEALEPTPERLTGPLSHRWLSPALFAVHHAPEPLAQDVLDFVSGQNHADHRELSRLLRRQGFRGPDMLGLPDYRTFGQIMAHLLGGVAAWARDAGRGGLLVLLDEAEYIDRLGAVSRDMAENVLRFLAMAALPADQLGFQPDGVYRGGQGAHRRIPVRYREDQPLAVLCAFTPNPQVDGVLDRTLADARARVALDPVRPSLLPVLAEKVYGLVKAVHPHLDPAPEHRQAVTSALDRAFRGGRVETTRQAARLVVEFWDLYRQDPSRALRALQGAGG
ncbi:MAG: DUF2791 family P-loop domain-containing protein [Alphaproteobacteria bacterium]|nr:DUF2791 family P-loop domain-containing protein [Alphaproteobacteria bacterium]